MVLAALRQPMYNQLTSTLPAVTDALREKRKLVKTQDGGGGQGRRGDGPRSATS